MRRLVTLLVSAVVVAGLVVTGLPPGDAPHRSDPVAPVVSSTPSFVIASFNLLGHSHTERGGKFARMSSGHVRLGRTAALFRQYNIAVAGLQEVHPPQYRVLRNRLAGYDVYPGPGVAQRNKQNVIVWKSSQFSLVKGASVQIPYKRGRLVPMPVVKLRHRSTGTEFWVVSVHNAPGKSRKARASKRKALARQVALTNRLLSGGDAVFMTGDMNDREGYFCRYTASRRMVAAAGGTRTATRCVPPPARRAQIDWVFGSRAHVSFSEYRFLRTPAVRRTSDHPLVLARATFRG